MQFQIEIKQTTKQICTHTNTERQRRPHVSWLNVKVWFLASAALTLTYKKGSLG